jgi:hypothetical protein
MLPILSILQTDQRTDLFLPIRSSGGYPGCRKEHASSAWLLLWGVGQAGYPRDKQPALPNLPLGLYGDNTAPLLFAMSLPPLQPPKI